MNIEDYGIKLNTKYDNGQAITKMLADGYVCDLKGQVAHIETPITIDGEGRILQNGVLTWKGSSEGTAIHYRGSRCVLRDLTIRGGVRGTSLDDCADYGINANFVDGAPTSCLRLDRVEFENMKYGFFAGATPRSHHTGNNMFSEVSFRGVQYPFWSENDQCCPNYFYKVEIRTGYEQAFTFKDGGGLHVYGLYLGGGDGKTLLWLPDQTKANNGTYEIQGLHVDGNNKNLTLVSVGEVAHRVRISGSVNKGGVTNPVELRLPARSVNVLVDCTNGAVWP